jgi:hypothetical protein
MMMIRIGLVQTRQPKALLPCQQHSLASTAAAEAEFGHLFSDFDFFHKVLLDLKFIE